MSGFIRAFAALTAAFGALTLAGCGGGGGGGGGGSNPGGSATFSLSATTFNFSAASESRPPNQTITGTVTGNASGTLYILVTPSNPNVATVESFTINGAAGSASIVAGAPVTLGGGNHTATIQVKACLNDPTCNTNQLRGSPQTITVNYSVAGVATSVDPATGLHYFIRNQRANGDTTQTFNVTGSSNVSWTLAADEPWLTLTPASGSTNAAVTVTATVPDAEIDRLRAGLFTSVITVTPSTGLPAKVPVSLHLDQAAVSNVAPYVDTASVAGDVIVRGGNFTGVTGVSFGGTPATQFSVVDNTQINATHPALPPGTYPVTLTTDSGVARSYANLKIVASPAYSPAVLNYPISGTLHLSQLLYDAERSAILMTLVDFTNEPTTAWMYRWEFQGAAWVGPQQVPLPVGHAMALAGDGRSLIVSYPEAPADVTVAEWDPATLTELKKTTRGAVPDQASAKSAVSMAVASDGTAVITTGSQCCVGIYPVIAYAPRNRVPLIDVASPFRNTSGTIVAGSADGGTVLVTSTTDLLFGSSVFRFDSSGPNLVTTGLQPAPNVDILINRNGSRIVLGGFPVLRLHDANLNVTGALPFQVALAPLSARGYSYDQSNNTVRVVDLTSPVNGTYPELTPLSLSADPGLGGKILVSPDERTLFIAGDERLIVQPL